MTDAGRYHHGNLRATLIAAGLEAARRQGPTALSLRELARATGVSASAAYRHFPDLEHLRAEVASAAREELGRRMLAALDEAAPRTPASEDVGGVAAAARFRASGEAYVRFAIEEPHLFEVAFEPYRAAPAELDDPNAWQILLDVVADMVATGRMDPEAAADAPIVAWSAAHGLASILVRRIDPGGVTPEDRVRTVIDRVGRALGIA